MKNKLIFFKEIPPFVEHETFLELCGAFGEIQSFNRPMNVNGIYLDFIFVVYKDERAIYYLQRYLIGLEMGGYKVNVNTNIVSFEPCVKEKFNLLTVEDNEIRFKLKTVLGKIEWENKIKRSLELLDNSNTLEMIKLNKIKSLQGVIQKKLKRKGGQTDWNKLKKLFERFN